MSKCNRCGVVLMDCMCRQDGYTLGTGVSLAQVQKGLSKELELLKQRDLMEEELFKARTAVNVDLPREVVYTNDIISVKLVRETNYMDGGRERGQRYQRTISETHYNREVLASQLDPCELSVILISKQITADIDAYGLLSAVMNNKTVNDLFRVDDVKAIGFRVYYKFDTSMDKIEL